MEILRGRRRVGRDEIFVARSDGGRVTPSGGIVSERSHKTRAVAIWRELAIFAAIAEPLAEKGNPPDLETGLFKMAQGGTFGLKHNQFILTIG
jgi:hypothetical protein